MTRTDPAGGIAPQTTRVMNLSHFLTQAARRYPAEIALVHGARAWSWSEIEARVDAMAHALVSEFGVQKGDRVLVQSANCLQLFESMFAVFRTGAVWVPTNYRQTPEDVAYLAQSSNACLMICQSAFPDHVEACRKASPDIRSVVSIGAAGFGEDYDAVVERHRGDKITGPPIYRDDPCWYFYTSGTTGRPKAAVLTHGQMTFVVNNHNGDLFPGTTQEDRSIVVAPLSHGAGVHQLCQVARGATTILLPSDKLDIPQFWGLVETWKVSNLFTVPTIVKMLVEDPSVDQHDHSSLRYVIYAGAPMYRADQKKALQKLGAVMVQYFGLGEVTGAITVLPPAYHSLEDTEARIGTCGFERTGMQIQIQDDRGDEVEQGATGEICVIGPAVFAGYYRNPEANEKAFRNGWFRTGDLGHVDAQGFLYITGRASDMYISGGSNVYPREIEEKLLMHPDLNEVAIVGVPDPVWGEVGIAVCVTRNGAVVTEAEVKTWLDGKVARYKMPKKVVFWSEMPKSAYGKITKKTIREQLVERGELPDEPAPKPAPQSASKQGVVR
ncbi:fatty-acyl-CoA synthase [Rhizobium sp. PP-F2F-G48]|uniref:acyl-CoA synthetase n=1 Tax=Rhizobium sp. PP-F2F-G48 TaxID=2135651 RepID=UPI00105219F7|nr:acyl-CoA synthetase [Rhizobium sp. PP-F2F-G48]TCM49683.1 fatty-acyl-CoA synthase [Rhizobium sp. PP-F2F-G48]